MRMRRSCIGAKIRPESALAQLLGSRHAAALGLLAFSLVLLQSAQTWAGGCVRDSECKGNRICENGQCIDPRDATDTRGGFGIAVPTREPPAIFAPPPTSAPAQREAGTTQTAPAPNASPWPATPAIPANQVGGAQQMLAVLVEVVVEQPGMVSLDGEPRGMAPVQIPNLPSGAHRLAVTFQDGGSYEEDLDLSPGETRQVIASPSRASRGAAARRGVCLGLEGSGGIWARDDHFGGGASSGVFANFGLTSVLDLRVGTRVGIGHTKYDNYLVTAPVSLRLNFGSIYSMMIGTELGWFYEENHSWAALYGAEASFATFRLGSRRQFEVGLVHGIGVYERSSSTKTFAHAANVVFSVLFL